MRALIPGCEQAGILLIHRDWQTETPAATSELVCESDRAQGQLGEGPCFDAAVHDQPVYRLANLNERAPSWPRYAPRARQLGIASMLGYRLYASPELSAALDVYATKPNAFTEEATQIGWLLSAHAAVAVAATWSHFPPRAAGQTDPTRST